MTQPSHSASSSPAGDSVPMGRFKAGSVAANSTADGASARNGYEVAGSRMPIGYASDLRQELQSKQTKNRANTVATKAVAATGSPQADWPLSAVQTELDFAESHAEVRRLAQEAFAMTGSWVVFYRVILGAGGVIDQLFPTSEQRRHFETTDTFAELLEMLTSIRSQDDSKAGMYEPERMITIRLPRSLHEATICEAKQLDLTINSYCITKLLQPANRRFTPLNSGSHRGRQPGPQIVSLERLKVPRSAASTAKAVKKKAVKKKAVKKKAAKKSASVMATSSTNVTKKNAAKKNVTRKIVKKKSKGA